MRTAITGGIGAGKSFVCRQLELQGFKVYDCDSAAKRLMRQSAALQQQLRQLVGDAVYSYSGTLQKRVLADFLLSSEKNKQAINDIVHPAVAEDFIQSGMEWLESAILFESGFDKRVQFDHIVCVVAPRETRLKRIMQRDNITREKAAEWIDAQMKQEKMMSLSDFCIINDGLTDIIPQIEQLLEFCKNNTK